MGTISSWFSSLIASMRQLRAGDDPRRYEMYQSDKDEWAARLALLQEQRERFEAGMEIEPPWLVTPEWEPRLRKWGVANEFVEEIWRAYIRSMTNEQRAAYFAKWPLPDVWWRPAIRDYLGGVDDPAWRSPN